MFCNNCGSTVPDKARFCGQCGAAVGTVLPDPPAGPGLGPGGVAASISAPGYVLDPRELEHPSMQKMNQVLRDSVVLRKSAESLSRKIGRPWYESTFNSVPVTETQYPRVRELALLAARRLGAFRLPSLYVELDRVYQSATYGTEDDAFLNVGASLPRFLNDRELLFVLGHEMGHLVCHHALWTTVCTLLVGQQRTNLMAEGVMGYLSNPLKIIEGGVESMVTNWMRVADFTADRAALLTVGSFDAAKKAVFLLHLRSRRELDEMDIDEWMRRVESQDQTMAKYSQMMTSATPYLSSRLLELKNFAASPQYGSLRAKVETQSGAALDGLFDERGYLKKFKAPGRPLAPVKPP
ncbi:MAG: M48 family metalloprotease, partial [Candidatus Aminicenantes bacterium]|nr:M48 family metalloprotease [Candidatus Aminicenantes bacterium]